MDMFCRNDSLSFRPKPRTNCPSTKEPDLVEQQNINTAQLVRGEVEKSTNSRFHFGALRFATCLDSLLARSK